jgi:Na+-translocating ferredoxin:NAD+ oxidoreductase RnfG subunit
MIDRDWLALLALPTIVISAPAFAVDYLTAEQAQKILFAEADTFIDKSVTLTDAQRDRIKQLSGMRQRWENQKIWRAEKNGAPLGWFIVDDVIGKHEFITYGVALSPDGHVLGLEIMSYRETHGGQIRNADWRANFVGKTLSAKMKLDEDIPNISGATLSCRNVVDGVKRLLALQQVALSGG